MPPRDSELPPDTVQPRVHLSTDPERLAEHMARENDVIAKLLGEIEARTLSHDEVAYLRSRKLADERASWLLRELKVHLPWIFPVCAALVTAIWWLATHSINVQTKP